MKNTFEVINLDDEAEIAAFIEKYGTNKGRRLANALGLRGNMSNKVANLLSGYAWNKQTAINVRKEGEIETALMYEKICDRIYSELPPEYRW